MKGAFYRNVVVLLTVFLSLSVAGCEDIENGVNEVERSISQTREDIDFLRWTADSAEIMLDNYETIKNASSERDVAMLEEGGIKLKDDSEKYLEELEDFSLSPSVEDVATEYRQFLQRSYEFGEFVENNSQDIDFEALEMTIGLMGETSELIEEVSIWRSRRPERLQRCIQLVAIQKRKVLWSASLKVNEESNVSSPNIKKSDQ